MKVLALALLAAVAFSTVVLAQSAGVVCKPAVGVDGIVKPNPSNLGQGMGPDCYPTETAIQRTTEARTRTTPKRQVSKPAR
jgi:hypothetical protein